MLEVEDVESIVMDSDALDSLVAIDDVIAEEDELVSLPEDWVPSAGEVSESEHPLDGISAKLKASSEPIAATRALAGCCWFCRQRAPRAR
jgi:hypothetical protein